MAGADRVDPPPLPQVQQVGRQPSVSIGHHAEDPSFAAVVYPQRSGDGIGTDRGAHHASLCRYRSDQRPDP